MKSPAHLSPRPRAKLLFTVLCLGAGLALRLAPARAQGKNPSEFVATFSTNQRVKQQFERLNRLATQKLWDEWLNTYQQIVNDPEDLVFPKDEEFLVGARYFAHQQLAAQPAAVRQKYRALFDAEARKVFDKARAEGDSAGMQEVYSRFRFSSSAEPALLWMAGHALDEGRAETARIAYGRLAKEPGVTAGTLLRYALAAQVSGHPAEAKTVLDRVRKDFGAQQVDVAGQKSTGAAAAEMVAKGFAAPAAPPDPVQRWSRFEGFDGGRRMGAAPSGGLKMLWEHSYTTQPPSGNATGTVQIGYSPTRFSFITFPVLDGDRIWVQGPRNLTQLNRKTGKADWDQQDFSQRPEEVPPAQQGDLRNSGFSRGNGRALQGVPELVGNTVFTRMPLISPDKDLRVWPLDFAITAMDARTGKQIWRKVGGGDPKQVYFNFPRVEANTVFTGYGTNKGGITEYTAVALDAGTGEMLWKTYLGAGSDSMVGIDGSPAAVKDGLVWIESPLYTLSALDQLTGEVRVIYRYPPERRSPLRGGFDTNPVIANEPVSLIATRGHILFAPRWGVDVVALDSTNGKLLWSSPKGPLETTTGSIFAVDDRYVYTCGDYLQAINLMDGARQWCWDTFSEPSSSIGFAALSGDRIYLPVEGKIRVHSALNGQELEVMDTSGVLGDSSGFCTVMPLGDMLLVGTPEKLVAFVKR